jgi:hypothetical protein
MVRSTSAVYRQSAGWGCDNTETGGSAHQAASIMELVWPGATGEKRLVR